MRLCFPVTIHGGGLFGGGGLFNREGGGGFFNREVTPQMQQNLANAQAETSRQLAMAPQIAEQRRIDKKQEQYASGERDIVQDLLTSAARNRARGDNVQFSVPHQAILKDAGIDINNLPEPNEPVVDERAKLRAGGSGGGFFNRDNRIGFFNRDGNGFGGGRLFDG